MSEFANPNLFFPATGDFHFRNTMDGLRVLIDEDEDKMGLANLCVIVENVFTEPLVAKEARGKERVGLRIRDVRLMNLFKSVTISVPIVESFCRLSFRSSNAKKIISSMVISSF